MKTLKNPEDQKQNKEFDDVLRRMLSTPPKPHKKPAKKQPQKTTK